MQLYLTLEPLIAFKLKNIKLILNFIVITNYILILPYHANLGNLSSELAIILNHSAMIILLSLINYYQKYSILRYLILIILNIPSLLVMKYDLLKYIY